MPRLFTRQLLKSLLDAARTLAGLNQNQAADALLLQVLKGAEDIQNRGLILDSLLLTGKTLAELGRRELALKILERALKLAGQARHEPSQIAAQALIDAVNHGTDLAQACAGLDVPDEDPEDDASSGSSRATAGSGLARLRLSALSSHPKAEPVAAVQASERPGIPGKARTVGFLSLEPHDYACPHLRLKSVLEHLDNTGAIKLLPLGSTHNGQFSLPESNLKRADVIVVQRQMAAVLPYAELRKRLGGHPAKIVFEIDDALTLLPEWHRASAAFRQIQPNIEEYLRQSDLVTVSTPQLKALYSPMNPNIVVLPNSLDARLWSSPSNPPGPEAKITVLFGGTLDHQRDLEIIEPALLDLIAAYPDKVEFLYLGQCHGAVAGAAAGQIGA